VIVTGEVEDPARWEAGFRTHGDLFRSMTVQEPIHFTTAGNDVAVTMEPEDMGAFGRVTESQETADAMASDGFKREGMKMFVLDKELKL